MPKENKRKFLVRDTSVLEGHQGFPIVQGYLSTEGAVAEVRTFGSFAFLAIRGRQCGLAAGQDFEYPIPLEDGMAMLECHCAKRIVHKTRHLIPHGDDVLEVDVFNGKLSGLVIAEIAPVAQSGTFDIPDWLGQEITGNADFSDFALAGMDHPPRPADQAAAAD